MYHFYNDYLVQSGFPILYISAAIAVQMDGRIQSGGFK
jgi:hypothetical protein